MQVVTAASGPYKQTLLAELDKSEPPTLFIIGNPDLIEAAGHSMDEIKNFDGLKAVAEDIHARAALVAALNQYNADQSAANWEQVRIAFVDGWAARYNDVNG